MDSLYIAMLLIFILSFGSLGIVRLYRYFTTTKTVLTNKEKCYKVKRQDFINNWTKYFWSNKWRFVWISVFFLFLILLGIAIGGFGGILFSVFIALCYLPFLWWARKSYVLFPKYAKEKLASFEEAIKNAIKKDTETLKGDNIQKFSDTNNEFDIKPQIFNFPVGVEKFDYPLFEPNPVKKTVIKRRKLEFLVLAKEFFRVYKNATTFDLINPARAPLPKGCVELKGAGPYKEHYYSQMQNVEYDGKAIVIKYTKSSGIPDVHFTCKKGTEGPALSAFQEKLRIIERQRLGKIQEYKYYKDIESQKEQNSQKKDEDDKK